MHTHSTARSFARILFTAALLCSLFTVPVAVHAESPYKILDQWKLADSGGWDYLLVDSAAHRIYITRGDHLDAVDATTGKLLGTISGLHGTHGVALNPDGKVGYISDGGGNAVVVFDRSNFSTLATIPGRHQSRLHHLRARHQHRVGLQRPQQQRHRHRRRIAESCCYHSAHGQARICRCRRQGECLRQPRRQERNRQDRCARAQNHRDLARRMRFAFRPRLRRRRQSPLSRLRRQKDERDRRRLRQAARHC